MRSGEVADKVEMLSLRSCDAERLFHESIRLVSVAIRSFVGFLWWFFCMHV